MLLCFFAACSDGLESTAPDGGMPDLAPAGECGGTICNVDFPCRDHSVCAGAQLQICKSTFYDGHPSAACMKLCNTACCSGGTCGLGAVVSCGAGTVCMQRELNGATEAECRSPSADGGADWQLPPDGGHGCR